MSPWAVLASDLGGLLRGPEREEPAGAQPRGDALHALEVVPQHLLWCSAGCRAGHEGFMEQHAQTRMGLSEERGAFQNKGGWGDPNQPYTPRGCDPHPNRQPHV